MSPAPFVSRLRRAAPILGAMAAAGLLWPGHGLAVVGGASDTGPLARGTVMVLNSRGGVCSGVVVTPDVVLTAAHCVAGGGEQRVHFRTEGGAPVLLVPAARAVHAGYDAGAVTGRRRSIDLALLRLPDPLPASFASLGLRSDPPPKGSGLVLGGYGVSREGDARSSGTFRTARLVAVEPHGPSRILVWASGGPAAAGACQGDSGGPVAAGDGTVVAVATWAAGRGREGCGDLTQGVLLGPQREWIDRVLSGWSRRADWH